MGLNCFSQVVCRAEKVDTCQEEVKLVFTTSRIKTEMENPGVSYVGFGEDVLSGS